MTDRFPAGMAKAARLTGAGKLAEATALIQRLLSGERPGKSAEPARGESPTIIDVGPVTVDAAAAPSPDRVAPAPTGRPSGRSRPGMRAGLGETLRHLSRVLPAGLTPGPGGMARPVADPPAADPLPEGASFTAASYGNAAGARSYKLYVPANRGDGRPLALIVMLHGCTQSPDDFAAGTRMNALAEERGFLVVYPEQPNAANPNRCWNWFRPEDQRRGGEPSLIAGITLQVMRDHPVDPNRVYVAGLSAGGAAAAIMGAVYPDLYAAVGVHSGLPHGAARDVASAFATMRQGGSSPARRSGAPVPTIVIHGDRDATVHPRNGDDIVAGLVAGAAGTRVTVEPGEVPGGYGYRRALHTDASGRVLCEQWTIHGAGHAWAGGSPAGTYTDPRGPDASREMVRFFLANPRRAS